MNEELKAKLLRTRNDEEISALLKDAGVEDASAGRVREELARRRGADGRELSLDELEAVSGGADRDWLTDGCAATVEPGSWCGSDDACAIWDVTYDHQPRQFCECGGIMYYTFGTVRFKCIVCGKEIDISDEHSRPIGDSPEGGPGRRPRRRRP